MVHTPESAAVFVRSRIAAAVADPSVASIEEVRDMLTTMMVSGIPITAEVEDDWYILCLYGAQKQQLEMAKDLPRNG